MTQAGRLCLVSPHARLLLRSCDTTTDQAGVVGGNDECQSCERVFQDLEPRDTGSASWSERACSGDPRQPKKLSGLLLGPGGLARCEKAGLLDPVSGRGISGRMCRRLRLRRGQDLIGNVEERCMYSSDTSAIVYTVSYQCPILACR